MLQNVHGTYLFQLENLDSTILLHWLLCPKYSVPPDSVDEGHLLIRSFTPKRAKTRMGYTTVDNLCPS